MPFSTIENVESYLIANAMAQRTISRFVGPYDFLSNFWRVPGGVQGYGEDSRVYATVEAAYQAAKTDDESSKDAIMRAPSATQAKRQGHRVKMRADFEARKVAIMEALVAYKFRRGTAQAQRLLATGDANLIEGNTWGDRFWGQVNGHGANNLGQILMRVRTALRPDAETDNDEPVALSPEQIAAIHSCMAEFGIDAI